MNSEPNTNQDVVTRYIGLSRIDMMKPVFPNDGWTPGMMKRYQLAQIIYIKGKATVTETIGYLHEDLMSDRNFWVGLAQHQGVIEILEPEDEPHSGITCEYTGRVIEEPFYVLNNMVDPTSCDGTSFMQGAEAALIDMIDVAEQYTIEGWSVRQVNITADIVWHSIKRNLDLTYHVNMYRDGDELFSTTAVFNDDKENTKIEQYMDPLTDVDDDNLEDEGSPRYMFIDALRNFFHIVNGSLGVDATVTDVEGSIVLMRGEHGYRRVETSRYEG